MEPVTAGHQYLHQYQFDCSFGYKDLIPCAVALEDGLEEEGFENEDCCIVSTHDVHDCKLASVSFATTPCTNVESRPIDIADILV